MDKNLIQRRGGLSAPDDAETVGLGNRLSSAADIELLVDVFQM